MVMMMVCCCCFQAKISRFFKQTTNILRNQTYIITVPNLLKFGVVIFNIWCVCVYMIFAPDHIHSISHCVFVFISRSSCLSVCFFLLKYLFYFTSSFLFHFGSHSNSCAEHADYLIHVRAHFPIPKQMKSEVRS